MSGLAGYIRLDGGPVEPGTIERMTAQMRHRGPHGITHWRQGSAALGFCKLESGTDTPRQSQPLIDPATGTALVFDGRIDNRAALLVRLEATGVPIGAQTDPEILLAGYRDQGADFIAAIEGDFAFALWDPAQRSLLAGRDRFAMRPLIYHHAPGRLIAFASDARALLALPEVPHRLDEGRIADFIVGDFEAMPRTLTYFEDIHRLAPAHLLRVRPDGLASWEYWRLEAAEPLALGSDAAYAEALRDVLDRAVADRLKVAAPGTAASMLSGGMDSGSIVSLARRLMAGDGTGPLRTISAIGPSPDAAGELRGIRAAAAVEGIAPVFVDHTELEPWREMLSDWLTWDEEPGQCHRTMLKCVFGLAARSGVRVLLNGGCGDLVFAEGTHLARLAGAGRLRALWENATGLEHFYGPECITRGSMLRDALKGALVPNAVRRRRYAGQVRKTAAANIDACAINRDFAHRIDLLDRLVDLHYAFADGIRVRSYSEERAAQIMHRNFSVGCEHWERLGARMGIECRDPFTDRRVIQFCQRLPGDQLLRNGWPKYVLRVAMEGLMPETVRWLAAKEHFGYPFTATFYLDERQGMLQTIREARDQLAVWFDPARIDSILANGMPSAEDPEIETTFNIYELAIWLKNAGCRPEG